MEKIKTLVLEKVLPKRAFIQALSFTTLVAVAVLAPFAKQQLITGSIVNATLFISAATLGIGPAILVGLVPSLVSLSVGLLPPVLAPMIPFIMVSNSILILVFATLKKKNSLLGVVSASLIKFAFLYYTSSIVVNLLIQKSIAKNVVLMMSWPQLITALAGGVIAIFIFRLIKSRR